MKINSFKDLYLAELQELASAEQQLLEMLPRLAQMSSRQAVKDAFSQHQDEVEVRRERLESILDAHDVSPVEHTDQGMQALVRETEKMFDMLEGDGLRDAGLIASAQRLAHYEIAAFGTVAALAGQLDLREEQQMLHTCLQEEKQADALLTILAKEEVNPQALRA